MVAAYPNPLNCLYMKVVVKVRHLLLVSHRTITNLKRPRRGRRVGYAGEAQGGSEDTLRRPQILCPTEERGHA